MADHAKDWDALGEALQRYVRLPLLRDHADEWMKTAPAKLGEKFAKSGQISATDSKDIVLWYTLSYSCMHFDALSVLLELSEFKKAIRSPKHVLHVDFGCGPGTATWAVIKNFLDMDHLETIGYDHNSGFQEVSTDIVKDIVHSFSQFSHTDFAYHFHSNWADFQQKVFQGTDRKDIILVTINSVFGQESFSQIIIESINYIIERCRFISDRTPIIICGTHPPYNIPQIDHAWNSIENNFNAQTIYSGEIPIKSWSPIKYTEDIRRAWRDWPNLKPQQARILVLPPTGGKR